MKELIRISELCSDQAIEQAFTLMRILRDRITSDTFRQEVRRQQLEGYHLYGGFVAQELVVLAGARRTHTLARGEHLFVDDLVTSATVQGKGYGSAMLRWLAVKAQAEGVDKMYLDSRATAKGFYEQVGFRFHSSIPCWINVADLLDEVTQ